MIKWIWESLNLLIEDIVRVLEYLYVVAGFTAFLWLYVMTVGPFRYLWGFRPKPPRKEKRENER